ncbi:hypothetical protein WME79_09995 [Sorangium sp. So ce726]|uniref:hypothetical protein n=1 Tax=Sorangium sp. So ce726 TaxID=3133319 RepID=UPI003F63EA4A
MFYPLGAGQVATGEYESAARWSSAFEKYQDARAAGHAMPIIFGDASNDSGHLYKWGLLDSLTVDDSGTKVRFSGVRDLGGHFSPELVKVSNREPVSRDVRRGCSIVYTPDFVTEAYEQAALSALNSADRNGDEWPGSTRMVPQSHARPTMRVFIANFGLENYLWPTCLNHSTVATFEDEDLRPFWVAGDRDGYIAHCIKTKKTAAGITPTAPVASRWYNLGHIISSTEGDMWIHRERDDLWWTISRPGQVMVTLEPAFKPAHNGRQVYVLQKPADSWSNKNKKKVPLKWNALHAKAREFLFTEGTLQQLRPDNAAYAIALVDGRDLAAWHADPAWRAKEATAKKGPVTIFSARQRAVVRMVRTAQATAAGANGQQVLRTVKNKDVRFASPLQFEQYVAALIASQDELCAITGLQLQFDGDDDDPELLCSLDRIDSDGHYEPDNLQVVCRFINRWKNNGNDAELRRLIHLVRTGG